MVFAEPLAVGWVTGNQSSLDFRVPGFLLRRLVEANQLALVVGSKPFEVLKVSGTGHSLISGVE
jgi:hypothetical protein